MIDLSEGVVTTLITGLTGLLGVAYATRYAGGWTRSQRLRKQLVDDVHVLEGLPDGRARNDYRKLVTEKATLIARDERLSTRLKTWSVGWRVFTIIVCVLFGAASVALTVQPGDVLMRLQSGVLVLLFFGLAINLGNEIRGMVVRRRQAREDIGSRS